MPRGLALGLILALQVFAVSSDLDWWKNAVIYQIYPRSFKDSGDDGIGDLKGIISKLTYIKNLGVDAIWLSPIYPSPNADFGYDVKDYTNINPEYGTLDDFDELIFQCRNLSIRVILDFVPNHSSEEHEWFIKSKQNDPKYKDYYVWRKPKPNKTADEPQPPNNWVSVMGGSAWTYVEERKQFYLHQFLPQQPDLNYNKKALVKEMMDAMRFWLDKGVNGFRMDAVFTIWEDQGFKNEPLKPGATDPLDYSSLIHKYTAELPQSLQFLHAYRQILDEYTKKDNDTRIMFTESYNNDIAVIARYYGNDTYDIANFPMNFFMLQNLKSESNATVWKHYMDLWYDNTKGFTANWVMGNHDNHRIVSPFRFSQEYADLVNMIDFSLKGVTITYNGEELGVEDSFVRKDQAQDPQGKNAPSDKFEALSRDPERGPFPWSSDGGFSDAKPWLPMSDNYWKINAENEKKAPSHLDVYQSLVKLKKSSIMTNGDIKIMTAPENILIIIRSMKDSPTVVTAINFGSYSKELNLHKIRPSLQSEMYVYTTSLNLHDHMNASIDITKLNLLPKSGVVLTTVKNM